MGSLFASLVCPCADVYTSHFLDAIVVIMQDHCWAAASALPAALALQWQLSGQAIARMASSYPRKRAPLAGKARTTAAVAPL